MIEAPKEKSCYICTQSVPVIDYTNVQLLQRFLSSYSKILPRKRTGVCAMHQRKLATAVKRARQLSLLPSSGR
ncbi:MAG: 30S ribosomal protein S18 [bacterium]|nr:30S ribosomal protein S18 [bacterium]